MFPKTCLFHRALSVRAGGRGGLGGQQQRRVCMAKVLEVKIRHLSGLGVEGDEGSGRGGWRKGRIESRAEERDKKAGTASPPPGLVSQPLGEVFGKHSFSGILSVLLPVVLLHAHQPAVVLAGQESTHKVMLQQELGCFTKLSSHHPWNCAKLEYFKGKFILETPQFRKKTKKKTKQKTLKCHEKVFVLSRGGFSEVLIQKLCQKCVKRKNLFRRNGRDALGQMTSWLQVKMANYTWTEEQTGDFTRILTFSVSCSLETPANCNRAVRKFE